MFQISDGWVGIVIVVGGFALIVFVSKLLAIAIAPDLHDAIEREQERMDRERFLDEDKE